MDRRCAVIMLISLVLVYTWVLIANDSRYPDRRTDLRWIKRWSSVEPVLQYGSEISPWPFDETCSRYSIYYCYRNKRTYKQNDFYFQRAIALWSNAFRWSALVFQQDPACSTSECFCKQGVTKDDTVIVSDMTSRWAWHPRKKCGYTSEASAGYQHLDTEYGRHYMNLCAIDWRDKTAERKAHTVALIAHEIGHVFGLLHEHQRTDAREYLDFVLSNFPDYGKTIKAVGSSSDPVFDGLSAEQRMEKIARNVELAKKHWPFFAESYVPGGDADSKSGLQPPHDINIFDYGSMMIYDSYQNNKNSLISDDQPHLFCIRRKDDDSPVLQGGHYDFEKKQPSYHDVLRICQLYPRQHHPGCEDIEIVANNQLGIVPKQQQRNSDSKYKRWSLRPIKVIMPNLTTFIEPVPAPTGNFTMTGVPYLEAQ